jgi:hypothetical protein
VRGWLPWRPMGGEVSGGTPRLRHARTAVIAAGLVACFCAALPAAASAQKTYADGQIVKFGEPTITGAPIVGQQLTAHPPTFTPPPTGPFVYVWYRCRSNDRITPVHATNCYYSEMITDWYSQDPIHTVVREDVGWYIRVLVVAHYDWANLDIVSASYSNPYIVGSPFDETSPPPLEVSGEATENGYPDPPAGNPASGPVEDAVDNNPGDPALYAGEDAEADIRAAARTHHCPRPNKDYEYYVCDRVLKTRTFYTNGSYSKKNFNEQRAAPDAATQVHFYTPSGYNVNIARGYGDIWTTIRPRRVQAVCGNRFKTRNFRSDCAYARAR